MKKALCVLLILAFVVTLYACNEESSHQSESVENPKENITEARPYYFFLFNSKHLNNKDKEVIEHIKNLHSDSEIVDFDVRDSSDAIKIYTMLKDEHKKRGGELKGIQIFGDSRAVPSFSLKYKVATGSGFNEGENFLSDYFYSNFNNDTSDFESFNIYDCFENETAMDFYPQWAVARLPMTLGKYAAFYENYCEYKALTEKQNVLTVAVSSPIFQTGWYPVSIDDLGYFLQRARDEWGILDEMKLYANTDGYYPSVLDVDGNCKAEEWTAESENRVCEYYIIGHSGELGISQTIYTSKEEYTCKPMISHSNINTYLSEQPYYINTVGCSTAKNMRENIIQIAMHGKCIGAFAATSDISNVDIDCMASEDKMQSGYTYHSLFYRYLQECSQGTSRAEAFLAGQQATALSLHNDRNHLEKYQYQNNYNNLLSLHNFGIID